MTKLHFNFLIQNPALSSFEQSFVPSVTLCLPSYFRVRKLYLTFSNILKDKNGTNYKDQGGGENRGCVILTAMENNIGPRMIHQIPMCSFVPQHLVNNLKYNYFHKKKKKKNAHITCICISKETWWRSTFSGGPQKKWNKTRKSFTNNSEDLSTQMLIKVFLDQKLQNYLANSVFESTKHETKLS